MQPYLEAQPALSRAERAALDEALFCLERSFDPAELPVYLPPVPRAVPQIRIPFPTVVPEYFPVPEVEYPLPSCPMPDETPSEPCGAVSDAGGSYQFTNLSPGVYEIHAPASPPESMICTPVVV